MIAELDTFRQRLESELASVDEALAQAGVSAATVALDQSSVGRLSRMDALQQQAMAQGLQERLLTRRRGLQAALARIAAGTFGRCCMCDAMIEPERLERDTAVVFCMECIEERLESGASVKDR